MQDLVFHARNNAQSTVAWTQSLFHVMRSKVSWCQFMGSSMSSMSNLLFPYSTTLSYWCVLVVAKGLPVLLQCSPRQEMTVVTIFSCLLSGKESKKKKSPEFPLQTFPHISPFRYCQRSSELQSLLWPQMVANPSLRSRRQGGRRELPDWDQLPSHACSRARRHCHRSLPSSSSLKTY